ncbi:MAG: histidine phosphatase family protein [Oscillospiraceae bacterium]|nr:histidine phosphatase family protein [Oscillospiraceae bacterium]
MRRVYLIRHAMPDIPLGERWCIGRSDVPLGAFGRMQAALLPFAAELPKAETVYCSKLSRSIDTARALCERPTVVDGLEEQDMGVWDGLSFAQIRERWPALYAAREAQPELLPDGAEPFRAVQARFRGAVLRCLAEKNGDVVIVSHKSAIASLTGERSALGYASVSVVETDGTRFLPAAVGLQPHPQLTDAVCDSLLRAAGADEALLAHCRAVAALADELCAALSQHGLALDAKAVHAAALLHDAARAEGDHAALGAAWLRELGYPAIAEVIRQHHDPDGTSLNEAAVVYLADKAVQGAVRVSVQDRFAASLRKCKTEEALAAHRKRMETAQAIRAAVNRLCGSELIQ